MGGIGQGEDKVEGECNNKRPERLAFSQNQTPSREFVCQIMNSMTAQYVAESIVIRKRRLTPECGFLKYTAIPRPKVMNAEARQNDVRMIIIGSMIREDCIVTGFWRELLLYCSPHFCDCSDYRIRFGYTDSDSGYKNAFYLVLLRFFLQHRDRPGVSVTIPPG